MVATAHHGESTESAPRARIRPSTPADLPYVVGSWRESWRGARECHRLRESVYRGIFDELVVRGVLALPETRVTVACDDGDDDVLLGWVCYAPGRVPVVHYGVVRHDGVRGRGLFAVLVAAAGVTTRMAYTFHPPVRRHRWDRRSRDPEPALLEAAARRGIAAVYEPVRDYLRGTN